MNIQDLRQGNFLQFSEDGSICYVKGIDADDLGITVYFPETKEETWIEFSQFEPIQLRPEIINKMGFNSTSYANDGKYNFWNKEEDASIDVEIQGNNSEFIFEYLIVNFKDFKRNKFITTVHQLQNLHYELKGTMLIFNQVS